MTSSQDRINSLLVDIQGLGIELAEAKKDYDRLLNERAELVDSVKHNAELYRRDMQHSCDLLRDSLTGGGQPPESVLIEMDRMHRNGRQELHTPMEVQ
jgi:hypothetical protein